jgi:serine/threonine protein kinase/Tfp pilus assembly protein PilF
LTSLEWTAKEQVPLLMIGQTLGHYRILEKVGAGGMGVVYRAHDEQLERDVAVKVLPPGTLNNDAARKHFKKEALALAKLNHPNIETIYEFNTQDGTDFLVMEYVPGKTLAERLISGTLPEKEAVTLGMQIAAAMEEAHNRGIVHRDLKPRNIALTDRGQAKVLDFGLARLLPQTNDMSSVTLTDTQAGAGTLPYMSPEQLQGEPVDARGDIYTTGAVLYEMTAGRRAFSEDLPSRLIDSILHQPPVPPRALNPRISPELERVILKCLDKDPARRFQTAKELLVDLRRLDGNHSADTTPPSRANSARTKVARFAPYAVAGLLILVILLTGLNVGGLRDRLMFRPTPARVASLAVLPLENLSHDPEQEYFADGMTEALITDIAKIRTLRVISRTSVMRYKGSKKPLSQIARELKVDAIVEGSVQRSGNQVRIAAQLIDARNDRNLWTESYQSDLSDVLSLQGNVARAIAGEIRVQLTPQESASLSKSRTVNPRAYESYLQGRYFWNKRTPKDLNAAVKSFNQAIGIDPTYARAYAGLADSYATLGNNRLLPPDEAFPKAKAAAEKALSLDEGLAEAHASLAFAHWNYDFDWDVIDREYKRAIELDPGYATAYHWYSGYLSGMGRHSEAIAAVKKARELDPLSPRINANVGFILYFARQYDNAIEELQRIPQMDTGGGAPYLYLGMAYLQEGKTQEGIDALEKNNRISDSPAADALDLAYGYAVAGRREDSLKLLHQVMGEPHRTYMPALWVARVYVALGEKENAMTWLRKAYDERSPQLPFLNVDPRWDPLRSDPQFQDLLRRMKLQS